MHPRLVLTVAATLACATTLAPATAEAQRVVVRKGTTTTTRTAQPPRRPTPRTTTVRVATQPRRYESMSSRQLSLSVGALRYAPDGDDNHPMAALRVDWRLRSWLRSEVGLSYALASLDVPAVTPGDPDDEISSSLLAGTIGLQAELPFRYVRPYVGAAAGLFARFDEDREGAGDDDDGFVRPTMAFPVGVRIPVSPRLGIRAEARFRFDEHRDGRSRGNVEQTVGLSFGF